jgi:hypothetical protein
MCRSSQRLATFGHRGLALWSILCLSALAAPGISAAATYYVDVDGRGGASSDSNAGTIDHPFKTIEKARDTIRALGTHGHTVYIRAGTYSLTAPLTFSQSDSGASGAPNVYCNYPGEQPIISGGQAITSTWSVYSGNIYVCDVGTQRFRSLWVDGVRATRARTPNGNPLTSNTCYYISQSTPNAASQMGFASGNINPNWTNLNQVEIQMVREFTAPRQRISSVNATSRVVSFYRSLASSFCQFGSGNRYWIENVFEGLDAPGEWYLNTSTNKLYYYPLNGKNPNTSTIVAGRLGYNGSHLVGTLIHCDGADYVELRGLTIAYGDWYLSNQGWSGFEKEFNEADGSPNWNGTGPALYIQGGAIGWRVIGCTLAHIGGHALHIYGHDIEVSGCTFSDIGASPIHVSAASTGTSGYTETYNITLADNAIDGFGVVFPGGKGVVVEQAHHVTVTHNTVRNGGYMGIQLGAGGTTTLQHDNAMTYNEVSNVANPLHDAAGLYASGTQTNCAIRFNKCHDIRTAYSSIYPDRKSVV